MMNALAEIDPPAAPAACWEAFCALNTRRRAIRDFDGGEIADADVLAILEQGRLAPSSANLQPYQLHWIRDPRQKALVAAACGDQRAARSASALIVVAASIDVGWQTLGAHLAYVEASAVLGEKSKGYHRRQYAKFRKFLRIAPRWIWAPVQALVAVFCPAFTLLPFGPAAIRHWVARSSIYAAQTILLAASARGLDSCPMEGFSARKVARILRLPRGTVIPIVIALGRRRSDASLDPQWRRPLEHAVVVH